MNAQSIWVGNDYAYHEYRRKGVPFQTGGQRVRAIGVLKEKLYGNDRDTAFVQVYFIDADGEIIKNRVTGQARQGKIRARDISMRWDEYEAEIKHREEEETRRQEEERIAREHHAKDRQFVIDKMTEKGFNMERVQISEPHYGGWVKIPVTDMKRWLRSNE